MKAKVESRKAKVKEALLLCLVTCTLCLGMTEPLAQSYPTRPVRIVVTYVPGGNTDVAARLVAPHMSENLGQPVVIDNRGGAGGVVGTEIVARAAPDGYTVLFGTSAGLTINPQLQPKLPYNVERDFAPISLLVINPQLMVAYPGLPAANIGEFLKLARAQPGKINYASVGVGSPNHLGMELLKNMAGIDIVHVPYKGSAPAVLDVMTGNVSVLFSSIPVMLTHVKTGKLKPLAIGSAKRSPAAPDIPTVAESVPGFEYVTWYGLFLPSATPRAIVARLNGAVTKSLRLPALDQQLRQQGSEPQPTTPEEAAKFMKAEHARWSKVVKATGLAGKINP
jgi:tripartite-type tricarboxylate transporter receptor subunit TctC